jgi:hypothetical protein
LFDALLCQAVADRLDDEFQSLPTESECLEAFPVSGRHTARMKAMFARDLRRGRLGSTAKWALRIAATIAIAAAILFGALLTVQDVRAAVSRTIAQWFDGYVAFTTEDATPATKPLEPTYIPEGYSETERSVADEMTIVLYANADGSLLLYSVVIAQGLSAFNTDGVAYKTMYFDGIEYHIFTSLVEDISSGIVWEIGGYRYDVSGVLPVDELLVVALSTR